MLKISRILAFSLVFCSTLNLYSQVHKTFKANRIHDKVKVDGAMDEGFWKLLPAASNFVQYDPYVKAKKARFDTKVKVAYDDQAIYVGAMLLDSAPDSILRELGRRDNYKNASYFTIFLDTYNDAKTAYAFTVTAAGVQLDKKNTESEGSDFDWDAVWESAVHYSDKGWSIEMKIPYSALRIPKKDVQNWGMQFVREIRRYREQVVWNPINPEKDGFNNQFGTLIDIKDIEPPLRLSAMPYVSTYADYDGSDNTWEYSYKGGMDLKLGINESFTLDMILIPDFGQVQSDDEEVNLGPYEQYYSEKRSFFMEGTELFSKGNIFYSRRIGNTPIGYYDAYSALEENEEVIKNPATPQLINATKISGKTNHGIGVGVLNAMTAQTEANVRDTITGKERKVQTDPFTNYNMLVIDKAINQNSYVALANTNVYRGKDYYMANVSALDFKLANKKNSYAIGGNFALSQLYNPNTTDDFGYKYELELGKISGKFNWNYYHNVESDTYDPNDMGYLQSNNDVVHKMSVNYNIYEPTKYFLGWYNYAHVVYRQLYKPREFVNVDMWMESNMTLKNNFSLGLNSYIRPTITHDYDESRVDLREYQAPRYYEFGGWMSPDYRKAFLVDFSFEVGISPSIDLHRYELEFQPRMRFSDKFTLSHELELEKSVNGIGYVDYEYLDNEDVITFGRREMKNVTNTLDASYIFSNKSALEFRLRHYWLQVDYDQFYALEMDGTLSGSEYNENEDFSANIFNIDMSYTWRFAPGSEMSVVWKNAIYNEEEESTSDYFNNFDRVLSSPAVNSLSIRVLYYMDYQTLFKKRG